MTTKDKILETMSKLSNKNAVISEIVGEHVSNPDAWVRDNILNSPEPVQEMFLTKITEELEIILEEIKKQKEEEEFQEFLRTGKEQCHQMLKDTDWTQLADAPVDTETRMQYRKYRQWLREKPKRVENKWDRDFRLLSFGDWKKYYL